MTSMILADCLLCMGPFDSPMTDVEFQLPVLFSLEKSRCQKCLTAAFSHPLKKKKKTRSDELSVHVFRGIRNNCLKLNIRLTDSY